MRTTQRNDNESLIDRRVGHGADAVGSAIARRRSKAKPATSEDGETAQRGPSRRNAGRGATAARNAKTNTAGMTAQLEDSRTKPSRKSTRGSANRAKGASTLQLTAQVKARSPQARAAKPTPAAKANARARPASTRH